MKDDEIRGRLLEHFHKLRHSNGGWIPVSDIILAPNPVQLSVIFGVCQQLADLGLIQWKPLRSLEGTVAGMAQITGKGVAAVEAGGSPEIAIRFPSANARPLIAPSNEPKDPVQAATKPAELVTLKPTFMGMSVDLKELWRRFAAWRETQP